MKMRVAFLLFGIFFLLAIAVIMLFFPIKADSVLFGGKSGIGAFIETSFTG